MKDCCVPATYAIDTLVIVVKETSPGNQNDHQIEDYGHEVDG